MKRFLFLLCAFSGLLSNAQDSLNSLPLSQPFSLLNERLVIACPPGSVFSPRPRDALSKAPSPELETRITYSLGKERLVIFVQEMNALATPHLGEDVKNRYTPDEQKNYNFRETRTASGLRVIFTTPTLKDSLSEAILIESFLIQMPDSSLIQVGAYINPEAYPAQALYRNLSERMMNEIKIGERRLALYARTENLSVFGNILWIEAPLPDKYIVLTEEGFGSTRYEIRKAEPLSRRVDGGIVLTTGAKTQDMSDTYGFEKNSGKEKSGHLLGQPVKWMQFENTEKHLFLSETSLSAGPDGPGLFIHCCLLAASAKELKVLKELAGTMSLKSK